MDRGSVPRSEWGTTVHTTLAHELYLLRHQELVERARQDRLVGIALRARRRNRRIARARRDLHRAVRALALASAPEVERGRVLSPR